jgi:hypothetical protein
MEISNIILFTEFHYSVEVTSCETPIPTLQQAKSLDNFKIFFVLANGYNVYICTTVELVLSYSLGFITYERL